MDALREGHKMSLSSGKVVALAAGFSVGLTVGYIFYRRISSNRTFLPNAGSVMTLPGEIYRNISRSQNAFLEMVNHKSGARVSVLSESGEPGSEAGVCFLLQGSKEQVLLAHCVLKNLISDYEPASEVLEVPQVSFGRIIGRGGESLKLITRTTGAKVTCSKEKSPTPGAKGCVTITGTRQEVKHAKDLILDKVRQDTLVRSKISQSSALRQKRHGSQKLDPAALEAPLGLNNNGHVFQPEKTLPLHDCGDTQEPEEQKVTDGEVESLSTESLNEISTFEIPSPDLSFQPDEHLEVFVSASENPNHFWIQILGVRSYQLDKLTEEMSRFYSSEQKVETVLVGDIVAAPYRDHSTWNRARVLGVLGSGLVDLYYVDFGDNAELPRDRLRCMRSDFLSLPFQAIECTLAGVKPKGEVWTEEALDVFEQLTHCASWRPLQAKLCSYSHSEISSWPSVKLYDSRDGQALDVGEELIRLGHAVGHQEVLNTSAEGGNRGSLQQMLVEAASNSGSVDVLDDELLYDQADK
uniref:Tudor and KH domain containing n=1 Tax=Oryzias latipes TaxID=8090 RepID=A0A3P9HZT6_ORYLA